MIKQKQNNKIKKNKKNKNIKSNKSIRKKMLHMTNATNKKIHKKCPIQSIPPLNTISNNKPKNQKITKPIQFNSIPIHKNKTNQNQKKKSQNKAHINTDY